MNKLRKCNSVDSYLAEIKRLVDDGDYPDVSYSWLLQPQNIYSVLFFSENRDAIVSSGDDLVQYLIINGYQALIEKAAYHAVLSDCDRYLLDLLQE